MKDMIIAFFATIAIALILMFIPVKNVDEEGKWRKKFWNPYTKRFFIISAAAVVVAALAGIFLWEWDGVYYIIFGAWTVAMSYGIYAKRKIDGRL